MRELANVLYVTRHGVSLRLEHDAVKITEDREIVARFPLMQLSSIVVFGGVHVSSALLERCARDGRGLVWLDSRGRFIGRLQGPTKGNVLLRRAQHLTLSDRGRTLEIARQIVAGKVQNTRQVLLRGARDAREPKDRETLRSTAEFFALALDRLRDAATLDEVRGTEGDAARRYFALLPLLLVVGRRHWATPLRTRRPPRDRVNAALSFLYALIRAECEAALEGVGLDPQVGFLHALRPGRPSLALDLMEELRPIGDRLVLTLVNRRQLSEDDFDEMAGGGVYLSESGRRVVIEAYQQRKEVELPHRVLGRKVPIGLIPHVQARLLARHLRADLDYYIPFIYR